MTIYKYEIEIKVTGKQTGESVLATYLEHAYSLNDALMQASVRVMREHGSNVTLEVLRIGPPSEEIRAQDTLSRDTVERVIRDLQLNKNGVSTKLRTALGLGT